MYSFDFLETARRIQDAYRSALKPVSDEFAVPTTAIEILLYLFDNPQKNTSSEICSVIHLKTSIVSFHTDNLVKQGYIARNSSVNDRRKYSLMPTERAFLIIERARKAREVFLEKLNKGLNEDDLKKVRSIFIILNENLAEMDRRRNN